jgi:excisionase family DNA binding protein
MTKDFNPTEWLTTQEAAELTGYDVKYLRQLVSEGKIKGIKRSRSVFIEQDSVMAYAEAMKALGPAKHDPWRTGARRKSKGETATDE